MFGVNPGIRQVCDGWAAEGYLALAPDLFWRMEPGVQLDADNEQDMARGFDFYGKFDRDKVIADIEATIKTARAIRGGKVGEVGYCMGGLDRKGVLGGKRVSVRGVLGVRGTFKKQKTTEA